MTAIRSAATAVAPGRSPDGAPMGRVLVLNASYEPLNVTSWRRATVMLLKGKAEHLEQARAYLSAGDPERAMTAVRQALAKEPENLDAMLFAARLVRSGGNLQAAESLYNTILEHHPDSAEALAGLGACDGLSGQIGRAHV